ncbi:MAG: nucleotidyltransferase domain-containing protein, partial [Candidatus Hydrothermarchaeota archaeon]
VSIILFGSVARGNATKFSDIDVLVVFKDLPRDWRERDKILDDQVFDLLMNKGVRLSPIVVDVDDIQSSAKWPNPLFYGVLLGYRVLYGREFFERVISTVKKKVKEKKPIYIEGGRRWDLAKMI